MKAENGVNTAKLLGKAACVAVSTALRSRKWSSMGAGLERGMLCRLHPEHYAKKLGLHIVVKRGSRGPESGHAMMRLHLIVFHRGSISGESPFRRPS